MEYNMPFYFLRDPLWLADFPWIPVSGNQMDHQFLTTRALYARSLALNNFNFLKLTLEFSNLSHLMDC
jgi:hypothetical protein